MNVAFIGGVQSVGRAAQRKLERELGIILDIHHGHTAGDGSDRLHSVIGRADLIVIVTGTNSHNAVLAARREAARRGVDVHLLQSCGVRRLEELVRQSRSRVRLAS
jgi:hypothetical protein